MLDLRRNIFRNDRGSAWKAVRTLICYAVILGLGVSVGIIANHHLQAQHAAGKVSSSVAPQQPTAAPGRVKLVLYERDGCKHCLDFEENVMPPLQEALGGKIDVERRPAEIDMETPTVIVEGRQSRTFVGSIDVRTLEDAIRELQ